MASERQDSAVRRVRAKQLRQLRSVVLFLGLVLVCSLATVFAILVAFVTQDNWFALPPGGVPEMFARIVRAFVADPTTAMVLLSQPGFIGVVVVWTVILFGARVAIFGRVGFKRT